MFNIDIEMLKYRIPAIILALTVHEFTHGLVAYLLGDKTAKIDGRLSFNPVRHIDPIGIIVLLIAGFGWAKPVMVNPNNLKNPKTDMALTAVAGPLSNFVFAFVTMMIYYPMLYVFIGKSYGTIMDYTFNFLITLFSINISLALFNLLPIPPLDGSKVFSVFLPEPLYFRFTDFKYGIVVLLILVYTGVASNFLEPYIMGVFTGFIFIVSKIYFFL